MANQIFSPGSIPLEGTSHIFANTPDNPSGGFRDIFVNQSSREDTATTTKGNKLQPTGKDKPVSQQDEQSRTAQDEDWEPTFVTPPEKNSGPSDDQAISTAEGGFDGEAFPVADLFDDDTSLQTYALTDADLAEPIRIEPTAAEDATAILTPEIDASEDASVGIAELAALQAGQYTDPVAVGGTHKATTQVEIAALNTRPFTQPIDADPMNKMAEVMPATSSVTASINADQAHSAAVPATSSGILQSAIRGVAKDETANSLTETNAEPDIVPATSASTLSAERLAELRQIQAYADNMVARANDGSSGSTNGSIDIAAMTARLDRSTPSTAAGQAALHTAPQSLNFTEKGWESAFGQNIQWMNANNIKSAQIRINPAELGPLKIDLTMNKDQLSLQIHATHQISRDTLEAALPRLRSELADQGFSNANIDMADQDQGQHAGQHSGDDDASLNTDNAMPAEEDSDAAAIVPATSAANLMSGSVSLLDTFA